MYRKFFIFIIVCIMIVTFFMINKEFRFFTLVTDNDDRLVSSFAAFNGVEKREVYVPKDNVLNIYSDVTISKGDVDIAVYNEKGKEITRIGEGIDVTSIRSGVDQNITISIEAKWATGDFDVYWKVSEDVN
ncbi:MAG: hypothetical protein ACK5LV_03675 [Lachnospirales bacterium]